MTSSSGLSRRLERATARPSSRRLRTAWASTTPPTTHRVTATLRSTRKRAAATRSSESSQTEELQGEINAALEAAAAAPLPTPGDLFDNIYEHPPERVVRQRAQWLDGQHQP